MRIKKLHYISGLLLGVLVLITMMSSSGGITGQSTAGCGSAPSCHGGSAASTSTVISITGLPAQYVNGQTYNLTLSVTNTTQTASAARAGFDMTVNTGSFTATAANTLASSTTELRHTAPKTLTSGATSWTFNWTAPATGNTQATFSVACNAANGNGVNDAGDLWNKIVVNLPGPPAATAPTVTLGTPSGITAAAATINGTVNANNASTTVSVEYGLTTSYGSTASATPATVTGSTATAVTAGLSGLTGNTTYHYRIKALNSAGTTYSPDATFTTLVAVSAPTVTVGTPSAITNAGATINGTVNANNGPTTALTVEYGLTTSYGSTATVTPNPVTGNTATAITAVISGLVAATTYHYRIVATNSAGTTNSPDATFTTLAAVTAATVVVGTPSGITFNAATVNGSVNANGGSTSVTVEYGTTTAYGQTGTVTPSPVSGNTATAVTAALSGLSAATTYHYRIVATNSAGTTNSPDATFTTAAAPAAPTLTITTPSTITAVSAIVNGQGNANNASATITVEWGLTISYGNIANGSPAVISGNTTTSISAGLTGLTPLTTYHYRFKAVNSVGTTYTPDATFTTLTNVLAPTVNVGTPSGITATSATINGSVNGNNGSTSVVIQYGLTASYGNTVGASPATVSGNTLTAVTGALSGLTPGTVYHYRIVATNSTGTTNSPDATFTTLGLPGLPVIVLGAPSGITSNAATINATVNANNATTTVSVEYGTTTAYGNTVNTAPATINGNTATPVSGTLTLLSPLTTYHYRVKAVNSTGTVYSADATFTTGSAFALPVITLNAPSNISYNRAVVNALVNANNATTSVTIEYGPTTAYGNVISTLPGQVAGNTFTAVTGIINQLQPNTLYHYRVSATNSAGTAYSTDDIFTTVTTSVATIEEGGFRLFPNPGRDQLTLTLKDNGTVDIAGVTMDGKPLSLSSRKTAGNQYLIDIAQLPAGTYFLLLKRNGQVYASRFSKQ